MSVAQLLVGGLLVALVGANVYWRHRLATVRDALITARDWDTDDAAADAHDGTVDGPTRLAIQEAADTAGVPVEELPERIETYEERMREQASEIEWLHEAWVNSWWEAATDEPVPVDRPRIVTLGIDAGGEDVVRTFAIHAMEADEEIVIAFDRSSGAFAVGVSDPVTDVRAADGIVDEIVARAGGGGGGAEQLATGGGTDPDAVAEAIDDLEPQLATELRDAFETPVSTVD